MVNQPLRNFGAILTLFALISPIFSQQDRTRRPAQTKPKASSTASKKGVAKPRPAATPKADPAAEKTQFDAAIAATSASEKAELLVKFIADYPKSEFKTRAEESLAGARAAIADERLSSGDTAAAVRLFKLAVEDAPKPYSDRLFSGVIATIPANLYWRGFKAEGLEIARLIEGHIASDANKLLLLSTFYLGSENGDEAKRIAEAAIKLDERNAAAHHALASAHRLNFDLEASAASFEKAVELDPASTVVRRSLADMKRALGKPDEAEKIYREILAGNEKDNQARTGLVLALFDAGKRAEAETEMAKALEEVPGNVVLLGSAAYWYAANKDGDKAVEYARRALEKEPRYIWSHIALGRGLMLQGKPVEAEQMLVAARKFGNFPTLQYEIASARLAAGFFREAAEELKKSFTVADGSISTRLGGRIEKRAESFTDALAMERRASIFTPAAADSPEDAARLKMLVELNDRLSTETKDVPAIVSAAESFAAGSDNMSVHRKLYAANLLLRNEVAADEAAKLAAEAVAGLDRSLDVANPGSAVMASELYEARNASFSRDDYLLIPEVPKQTLNSLMRGRVEETAGLALLKQGKPEEATVRFRRALTVLPKDSAWWRSATWNLGTSLAAEGKDKEALDTMVASYVIDKPNVARYILIEQLWQKVNGNREGFEEKLGPNPMPDFSAAKTEPTPQPAPTPAVEANIIEAASKAAVESSESPTPEVAPQTVKASPTPEATPTPEVAPETVKPSPTPETTPTPEVAPETVKPTPIPEATPTPEVAPETVKPSPIPETTPTPEVATETVKPTPTPETTPTPEVAGETVKPSPTPEVTPIFEATPETVRPSPTPETASVHEAARAKLDEVDADARHPSETAVAKLTDEPKPKAAQSKKTPGQLFEPIVITIPKPTDERRTAERKPTGEPSEEAVAKPPEISTGVVELDRPRVVKGKEIIGELMPCEIGVSQENFSIINNGGSIALLVSVEQGEDIRLVTAESSSPQDIEVRNRASEIARVSGRLNFVIRSISRKTGLYQVTFKAPCGKRIVTVRVR